MNGFEKRTKEKKEQILNSTFALMNTEQGISGVRMEDIVKHSGVGKTTIFKYFGSKDNLFHEVFKKFIEQLREMAKETMAKEMTFEETLIALSQNKINVLKQVDQQFYIDAMNYFTEKSDDGRAVLMEAYAKESFGLMLDVFHRGKKEGKVDLKYSDEFLMLYFQALVEGISNPNIYEKILPYTNEWTEMVIKGIAPAK
jgi:AcrR family transcriptional regulator